MREAAKHRVDQYVDKKPGVQVALKKHGDSLRNRLQGCGGHHIAEQLYEVCVCRVAANHKSPLTKTVEEPLAAVDIGGRTGGDNKELPRLGSCRITEDRSGDIALSRRVCSLARNVAVAVPIVLMAIWIAPRSS